PAPIPPDVWDPWRRHAEQGIRGLIDAWWRVFSGSGGGNGYDADCDEEWKEAREACRDELAKPNPSPDRTGGNPDIGKCARGLVSERCGGGNKLDYSKPKRSRSWKFD